ncbi:Single-stranded DNA-binding protein [hydrothermal vent metagenome]|uniref:Single-stranded DNA-binding protein n=1 Tax=hydrothermal vent metagenome TaxID=652676 RepID=A0A1W1ECA1_9ZZZZ
MYSKTIIAGNLTRDIEMRYTQKGAAIASTAIASTRKFKNQNGEMKEEVLFLDITFFGRTGEIANQYLRKGSKILVDGRLKLDQWTAQDGSKRSKHSLVVETLTMLGKNGEPSEEQPSHAPAESEPALNDETVEVEYLGEKTQVSKQVLQKMHVGNVIDITFASYALQFVKEDNSTFKVTKEGLNMQGDFIIPEETTFKI